MLLSLLQTFTCSLVVAPNISFVVETWKMRGRGKSEKAESIRGRGGARKTLHFFVHLFSWFFFWLKLYFVPSLVYSFTIWSHLFYFIYILNFFKRNWNSLEHQNTWKIIETNFKVWQNVIELVQIFQSSNLHENKLYK